MEEELHESRQTPGGDIPLGVRLTEAFLGLCVFVLTLPTAGAGFVCLASLAAAAHEPELALASIAGAGAVLVGFCVLLAAMLGASWLLLAIRAPHEHPDRARWPNPPLRAIVLPLLGAGRIYSGLAAVAWLTVMIGSSGTRSSWIWLCFWGAFGVGCHFFVRMIQRHLGAQ